MKSEKLELVRGSGNVFATWGMRMPMPDNSRPSWPPKSLRRWIGNT